MKFKKKNLLIIFIIVVVVYIVLFPSPSPEIAIRKYLFLSFQPIGATFEKIQEGIIKNDPKYGDLYIVNSLDKPFIYVKKNFLGWRVDSTGSGP